MRNIYLLLGTNMGNRLQYLLDAQAELQMKGVEILGKSAVYETSAWGKTDQATFLNQVVEVEASISAYKLLTLIQRIEKKLGRKRKEHWGPRCIDIDILYFGNEIIESKELTIPHPGIPDRAFTLLPLVEIAPEFKHPQLGMSNLELLKNCKDELTVIKLGS